MQQNIGGMPARSSQKVIGRARPVRELCAIVVLVGLMLAQGGSGAPRAQAQASGQKESANAQAKTPPLVDFVVDDPSQVTRFKQKFGASATCLAKQADTVKVHMGKKIMTFACVGPVYAVSIPRTAEAMPTSDDVTLNKSTGRIEVRMKGTDLSSVLHDPIWGLIATPPSAGGKPKFLMVVRNNSISKPFFIDAYWKGKLAATTKGMDYVEPDYRTGEIRVSQ